MNNRTQMSQGLRRFKHWCRSMSSPWSEGRENVERIFGITGIQKLLTTSSRTMIETDAYAGKLLLGGHGFLVGAEFSVGTPSWERMSEALLAQLRTGMVCDDPVLRGVAALFCLEDVMPERLAEELVVNQEMSGIALALLGSCVSGAVSQDRTHHTVRMAVSIIDCFGMPFPPMAVGSHVAQPNDPPFQAN